MPRKHNTGHSDKKYLWSEWHRADSTGRFIGKEAEDMWVFDIDLVEHDYKKVLFAWEVKVFNWGDPNKGPKKEFYWDRMKEVQTADETRMQAATLRVPLYILIILPADEKNPHSTTLGARDIKGAALAPYRGGNYTDSDVEFLTAQELAEKIVELRKKHQ